MPVCGIYKSRMSPLFGKHLFIGNTGGCDPRKITIAARSSRYMSKSTFPHMKTLSMVRNGTQTGKLSNSQAANGQARSLML